MYQKLCVLSSYRWHSSNSEQLVHHLIFLNPLIFALIYHRLWSRVRNYETVGLHVQNNSQCFRVHLWEHGGFPLSLHHQHSLVHWDLSPGKIPSPCSHRLHICMLHPCLWPPLISYMDKGCIYKWLQGERILKHSELLLRDVVLVMPGSSDWFITLSRTITHCQVRART